MTSRSQPLPESVSASVANPARRDVVAALLALESEADPDLERLSRMAATMFGVPMASISFIDEEKQRIRSSFGLHALREVSLADSFCAHTIAAEDGRLIVMDAQQDSRFDQLPSVAGEPFIRFYTGVAVNVRNQQVGTIAVFSAEPRREISATLIEQLQILAETAASLLHLKLEAQAQARTAAALIKEEWRHALTLEAGKVGSWVWDVRTGEMVVSDIMRRMFGLDPNATVMIDDIFSRVHPLDVGNMRAALNSNFHDGGDYEGEYRLEASDQWQLSRGRVYQRDAGGKPLIMMGINFDITDSKRAADHTRLLLRELNHRVKNTLAMIQSLARQTVKSYPDPAEFISAFSGRLRTLSDAHAILSNRDWSGIRLMELIEGQVLPQLSSQKQLVLSGNDVDLPADHALGLSLILHELVSNALGHGALSRPGGRIRLSWTETPAPNRRVDLVWKEEGGPVVIQPKELGFGGKLIERSLAKVIDSSVELTFPPDGVSAKIAVPLPDLVEEE